jgi:hypothetical protein
MPGIQHYVKIVVQTTEEFEELIERMSGKSKSSKSTFSKSKQAIDTKDEPVIESKEESDG